MFPLLSLDIKFSLLTNSRVKYKNINFSLQIQKLNCTLVNPTNVLDSSSALKHISPSQLQKKTCFPERNIHSQLIQCMWPVAQRSEDLTRVWRVAGSYSNRHPHRNLTFSSNKSFNSSYRSCILTICQMGKMCYYFSSLWNVQASQSPTTSFKTKMCF